MYSFIDTNNPVNVPLNPHFERKTVSFFQNHEVFVSFSQNHLWSYPLISSKTKILTIFQWPNLAAILIGVSPAELLTAIRFPTKKAKKIDHFTISLFYCFENWRSTFWATIIWIRFEGPLSRSKSAKYRCYMQRASIILTYIFSL